MSESIIQNKILTTIFPIIIGCVLGPYLYSMNFHIAYDGIALRPSHLLIFLAWILSIEFLVASKKKNKIKIILFSTSISISIVSSYMLNNGNLYGMHNIIFNIFFLIISLCLTVFFLLKFNKSAKYVYHTINFNHFLASATLFTILFVRGGNMLARNLPNKSRSLMIHGVEFHHLLTGLLIISISQLLLLFCCNNRFIYKALVTFLVIGLALIADQVTYILIVPLSDEAFFSPFSFWGAIVCIFWILFRIYLSNTKGKLAQQWGQADRQQRGGSL